MLRWFGNLSAYRIALLAGWVQYTLRVEPDESHSVVAPTTSASLIFERFWKLLVRSLVPF